MSNLGLGPYCKGVPRTERVCMRAPSWPHLTTIICKYKFVDPLGVPVLNLSLPDLFLFWICSTKYSTALHSIFNIIEKAQKIQYT